MHKTLKRTLAIILAVILCLGAVPFSAFAAESSSPAEITAETATSEPLSQSSSPDTDESLEEVPAELDGELESDSEPPVVSPYETELAQMDAQQIWPALQRAKARAAAGVGTGGVLQMGY